MSVYLRKRVAFIVFVYTIRHLVLSVSICKLNENSSKQSAQHNISMTSDSWDSEHSKNYEVIPTVCQANVRYTGLKKQNAEENK